MGILKNIKWILIAVLIFAVGHYLIRSAASNLSLSNPSFTEYISWLNLMALVLYLICGVVASYLSKKQFLITGTVTGFLSAITAMFFFNVAVNDVSGKVITLVTGLLLGAIGGAIAKLLRRRLAHAL